MSKRVLVASIAALLLVASAGLHTASAHANLVKCSIKGGQVFHAGHSPSTIQAFFAEDLVPSQSWISLYFNQEDHGLVNETTKSKVNFQNPKEITLRVPKLDPGLYDLIWYTHSADDGHWAAGNVFFRVTK